MLPRIFVWFMACLFLGVDNFNWTATWRIAFWKFIDVILTGLSILWFFYRDFWRLNSDYPLWLVRRCIKLWLLMISNKCLVVILLLVPHRGMYFVFEFIQILRITFLIDWDIVIISTIPLREWMIFLGNSLWRSNVMLRGTRRLLLFQSKWNKPFLIL